MKGYTNVLRADIQAAVDNWKARYDQGPILRDKGVALFYEKHYEGGSKFHKWWYRNTTPHDYARSRINFMDVWSDVLYGVLSDEETNTLNMWCWSVGKESYKACKGLLGASSEPTILLSDQLCLFVNKYKEEV